MALTLAQHAKIEHDPRAKYVITNLLREIKVMEVLPFVNVNSLTNIAVRWRNLPDVNFRQINEGYTPGEGDTEQVWESIYILGGEIKFDRIFDKVTNTVVPFKKLHTDMKITALALYFNEYFIAGDHASEPDGFEGLTKRISNMPTRQKVGFAGAAASVLDPTASATAAKKFFDVLEEMHYKTNRGDVQVVIGNEGFYYGLGKVSRYLQSGGAPWLDTTQDSFDRQILTYKGAPIIDIGLKGDQSTEIITNTELAGDAASDATSCYMCSFNERQGITGIQLPPGLEVYDPLNGSEQESTPTKLLRIEWPLGLAGFGSYGITRGWNLEDTGAWT